MAYGETKNYRLTIICRNKNTVQDLVNKGSNFADFVRFRPHTYARNQQSLPSNVAITQTKENNFLYLSEIKKTKI